MVEDFNAGRARCTTQWGDDLETTQIAIELCPVDCIYWVNRSQLPLLEYAMRGCKREDIAIMARRRSGNMGSPPSGTNPFANAEKIVKLRREGKAYVDEVGGAGGAPYRGHDEKLSGAIASAWLALPRGAREKGWPAWNAAGDERPLAEPGAGSR
jgi:ferredoxin